MILKQVFFFIGAVFDPATNAMASSAARVWSQAGLAGSLSKTTWLTATDVMEVLGNLASLKAIAPLARLHMRGLQSAETLAITAG